MFFITTATIGIWRARSSSTARPWCRINRSFTTRKGAVATDATYQVYQDYNGVSFPNVIEINRPQEEYSIRLTVVKLVINDAMRDDQFALQQPPGSQLVDLDQPNQSASSGSPSGAAETNSNTPKK